MSGISFTDEQEYAPRPRIKNIHNPQYRIESIVNGIYQVLDDQGDVWFHGEIKECREYINEKLKQIK